MSHVRRFVADLIGAYIDGVRTVRGLPWLFGVIVTWEFAQHIVEYRIGFFESRATAKAVSLDGSRMMLGWMKMLLVYVGGFFSIRYLVLGKGAAMRPRRATILRYLPYIAYSLMVVAPILYADQLVPSGNVMTLRDILGLGQLLIEPLLMLWIVSAAVDGPVRTPLRSALVMGRWYVWALALFCVGRLPISLIHYWLGTFPIGRPGPLLWPTLGLDAFVVGLLIATIPAIYVRIVRRIGEEKAEAVILSPTRVRHPS